MVMLRRIVILVFLMPALVQTVFAQTVIDEMLEKYRTQGASNFSAEGVDALWNEEHLIKGKQRSCTSCHGKDLTLSGKHAKTGKVIKPLALSVNKKRFTKVKKIRKWFKRNCKWAWGRECTAQEKGNFLVYLRDK